MGNTNIRHCILLCSQGNYIRWFSCVVCLAYRGICHNGANVIEDSMGLLVTSSGYIILILLTTDYGTNKECMTGPLAFKITSK